MGRGRLELPRLAALAPKASVSTIPPPAHCVSIVVTFYIFLTLVRPQLTWWAFALGNEKIFFSFRSLVRPLGFEPRTVRLRGDCSTS